MQLKAKKLHPNAKLPAYVHPGDVGMDFFALEQTPIKPGQRLTVKTGIALEIPDGYAGLIWDKSGIAIKEGIKSIGGVFDAGYRGEILIGMINLSDKEYVFEAGHKVAQMIIQRIERCDIIQSEHLSETSRGSGSFGSTGK